MTSRLRTIDDVMEVTTKPIILDGDTGGLTEHFVYNVRTLERMGFPPLLSKTNRAEKNSLFGTEVEQTQESIENFCEKIRAGKNAQLTDEFMIIARIESLILEKGDAGRADPGARAFAAAGADGIMIHSRKRSRTKSMNSAIGSGRSIPPRRLWWFPPPSTKPEKRNWRRTASIS